MKPSLLAFSCILFGAVACTAPQGKKLSANSSGLVPVATGPTSPVSAAAVVSEREKGSVVSVTREGTVTVSLPAAEQDGYSWRLSEIPDPTVLKLVSQNYAPPAEGGGRGEEKWVFQAVGPGDVNVKMWYGDLRITPVANIPDFDFIASVSEHTKPAKKSKRLARKG